MRKNILIVEDEVAISRFLQLELEREGYLTSVVANGRIALETALREDFDLIVLDVMLPEMNGIEVLRRLREKKKTPVIILTARDQIVDKVSGLDLGADDYMTKPFAIEELLARIRSVFNQREIYTGVKNQKFIHGKLAVDCGARTVIYNGINIDVPRKEFDLLVYLLSRKNVVVTREEALEAVWGYEFFGNTNVVDVYIRYLRQKIDERFGLTLIETVRGTGYVIR